MQIIFFPRHLTRESVKLLLRLLRKLQLNQALQESDKDLQINILRERKRGKQ